MYFHVRQKAYETSEAFEKRWQHVMSVILPLTITSSKVCDFNITNRPPHELEKFGQCQDSKTAVSVNIDCFYKSKGGGTRCHGLMRRARCEKPWTFTVNQGCSPTSQESTDCLCALCAARYGHSPLQSTLVQARSSTLPTASAAGCGASSDTTWLRGRQEEFGRHLEIALSHAQRRVPLRTRVE